MIHSPAQPASELCARLWPGRQRLYFQVESSFQDDRFEIDPVRFDSLRQRVLLLGGEIEFERGLPGGGTLTGWFPLDERDSRQE